MSITPMPEFPSEPEGIHLSALDSYIGRPGALLGATFGPRVAARILDELLHLAVSVCSGALVGFMIAIAAGLQHQSRSVARVVASGSRIGPFVFTLLGSVVLHTVCEGFHGSTLGKLLLGLVVVQDDGTPCRPKSALIRSLGYFVDSLFFGLVGYHAMQQTPQQQRYGDQWADTIVCKRTEVAPQNLRGSGQFIVVLLLAVMADSMFIIIGLMIKRFG